MVPLYLLLGIYQDEVLPVQMKEKAEAVKESEEMLAEEKVAELVSSLNQAVRRSLSRREDELDGETDRTLGVGLCRVNRWL